MNTRQIIPGLLGIGLIAAGVAGLLGYGPGTSAPGVELRPDAPTATLLSYLTETTVSRRTEADEGWARRLLQVPPDQRRNVIDQGIHALSKRLAHEPTDGSAWLTLAMLTMAGDGLQDSVIRALRLSYYNARNELAVMRRRTYLTLLVWPLLPADVQREALLEIDVLVLPNRDTDILRDLTRAAVRAGPVQWAMVRERYVRTAPELAYTFDTFSEDARKGR